MPAREPKRTQSAFAGVKALLDALRALDADPDAQADLATSYVRTSKNMEVLRPALNVLQAREDPSLRPLLHEKYAWCAASPERNDSGGGVRAAIVRAVQPIIHQDDLPVH